MSAEDDRPMPDLLAALQESVDRARGTAQRFRRGDRVQTANDGLRATVTGPAPRGPHGEPAVNLDWDGPSGGPAYEQDLEPASAEPPAEPWCGGTGPSGLRAAQECAATHDHSAAPSGADEPPLPSPDPRGDGLCPNCPTDLATLDSGHGVCVECGWTSDPGKCMELYDRIDELVAVARSVVDLMDRTVDMPGVVRDVVDNLRDALSAAPADDTAAPDGPTS